MSSLILRTKFDSSSRSSWILPLSLVAASLATCLGTPIQHSLLTSAVAWILLCIACSLRATTGSLLSAKPTKAAAWSAGLLLALGQICERAVNGKGIWWAKALVPITIHLLVRSGLWTNDIDNGPSTPSGIEKERRPQGAGRNITLVISSLSALVAIFQPSGSNTVVALGLSYTLISAAGLLLLERAFKEASHPRHGGSVIYSANGLLAQPANPPETSSNIVLSVLRDVSAAAGAASAIAAVTLDSWQFGGLTYWGLLDQAMGENWVVGQGILSIIYAFLIVLIYVVLAVILASTIYKETAFATSFAPLLAALIAQLLINFSTSRLWFASLFIGSAYLFFDEADGPTAMGQPKLRFTRALTLLALISFTGLFVQSWQQHFLASKATSSRLTSDNPLNLLPPPSPLEPMGYVNKSVHPIHQVVRDAESEWESTLGSQSQGLGAAVAEYKKRYGISPPPNFDKWFEFAKKNNVQLVDEYDTIHDSLLPFWALSPATIRARTREALGFRDNNLIGLLIRDGRSVHVEGGQDWQQQATVGMIEKFVQFLPDMDLAFNIHDEPRVVVPHDVLARLLSTALSDHLPAAAQTKAPRNSFSTRPQDIDEGKRIDEVKTTRFNVYAHQPVWEPSRLSCPPNSPARAIEDAYAIDNLTSYALGELGFVYNQTAFSDVCNSPSFRSSHGFFDRPNAFNVVHDLFPIFSQSKMSCFQDILYPSPWYWFGKVTYNEGKDMVWEKKEKKLWWRGSTTGGFSRNGGWRRQHRQQIVRKINAPGQAKVLANANKGGSESLSAEWKVEEVARSDYRDLMDVFFSHVGQCDPGDCDAQQEFFTIAPKSDQQDAWNYRYLLDIDGNAFSGRFYAFLQSHSLVFKMAVFREWHEEWIKPWVHYVPLSLRADDTLEAVRYFSEESEGMQQGVRMAEAGRDWANKALRNVDFEAWFFRLLLEYGRLIDDDRAVIGYSGS